MSYLEPDPYTRRRIQSLKPPQKGNFMQKPDQPQRQDPPQPPQELPQRDNTPRNIPEKA